MASVHVLIGARVSVCVVWPVCDVGRVHVLIGARVSVCVAWPVCDVGRVVSLLVC